jgi:hypothetical protein
VQRQCDLERVRQRGLRIERTVVEEVRDTALTGRAWMHGEHHDVRLAADGVDLDNRHDVRHVREPQPSGGLADERHPCGAVEEVTPLERFQCDLGGQVVVSPVADQDLAHPAGQHLADTVAAVDQLAGSVTARSYYPPRPRKSPIPGVPSAWSLVSAERTR